MDTLTFIEIVLTIIGVAFLIGGIKKYQSSQWLIKHGTRVEGSIIDVREKRSRSTDGYYRTYYYPVFYFELPDGTPFSKESEFGTSWESHNKGDKVDILFDPEDPNYCSIDSKTRLTVAPVVFAGTGVIMLVMALLLFLEVIQF